MYKTLHVLKLLVRIGLQLLHTNFLFQIISLTLKFGYINLAIFIHSLFYACVIR